MFKSSDSELIEKFYKLQTRYDVASLLEIEERSLRYFLYIKKTDNLYTSFEIPKSKGGVRSISAPHNVLKSIQRKLAYVLNLIYKPKASAYGFVKNKNIILNAQKHTKRKWILNIDLKDFFTQITFARIMGMFINKPYGIGKESAMVIAQIACYHGVLPQGAPSSPILTNMICSPLDTKLIRFAKENKLGYTRYADDITFSTYDKEMSHRVIMGTFENLEIGITLKDIIKNNDFVVNENKIFLNGQRNRQEVTGLVVNQFVNVKREYIKNIRAILHHCKTKSPYMAAKEYIEKGLCKNPNVILIKDDDKFKDEVVNWFLSVIKGKLMFLSQIRGMEDFTFLKYAKQANDVFNENIFNVSKLEKFNASIIDETVIIQSTDDSEQGSGFLLKDLGLVTSYHVTKNDGFYNVLSSKGKKVDFITKNDNELYANKNIDYAIYHIEYKSSIGLELGNSEMLEIGDKIIMIGYPNYQVGDSPNVQTAHISGSRKLFGTDFYTVDKNVFHGASGGVVLNEEYKVIGIIMGGVESLNESQTNVNQGFMPIHLVINDISKDKSIQ